MWGKNQERHQIEVFENKEWHGKLKLQYIKKKKMKYLITF
jgi:hypothetical protein